MVFFNPNKVSCSKLIIWGEGVKKIVLSLLAASALLSGCTTGQMSQAKITTSQFDNSKNISAREMPALGKDKWHPSNVFLVRDGLTVHLN